MIMLAIRRRLIRLTASPISLQIHTSQCEQQQTAKEHIEIPKRIDRSPTDILLALAGTVGRDRTAVHYKYHDDPYLLPLSNVTKLNFAITQEAGRKAARFIKAQQELLLRDEYKEISEIPDNELQYFVKNWQVSDAIRVYNQMKENKEPIEADDLQSFLELLCFYNGEDRIADDLIEERAFLANQSVRDRGCKSWKDGDLAENIFAEIKPKTPKSYAALIRGMAAYFQAERANALLHEAIKSNIELDTATFNSVINVVSFIEEIPDKRWELCQQLLERMAQLKLQPDVGTLNALLECISSFNNIKLAHNVTAKTLAEFKMLGIEPSLGTYYYALIIFSRNRGLSSHVLTQIMEEIEGKEFRICHPKDTYFFTTAMEICRQHIYDRGLAEKLNALLHFSGNYDLIGDSYKECVYYRHYFGLLAQTESIEGLMQTYDLLVPSIYVPEPGIMEDILISVENNAAYELLPKLWSDMVIFDHTNREGLLKRVLKIMLNYSANTGSSTSTTQLELSTQFSEIALEIYRKIKEQQTKVPITGQIVGDILTLLLRGNDFTNAIEVFNTINKEQHRIPGTPSDTCLGQYIDACIVNKSPAQASACLQYALQNHIDTSIMEEKINTAFPISNAKR